MRTGTTLALAVAFLVLPLPLSQVVPHDQAAATEQESTSGPDDNPLPWFLTDIVIPEPLPPNAVLPSWAYENRPSRSIPCIPSYNTLNISEEQLEGPANARTTYPLLKNLSLSISFEWDATVTEFQDMDGGLRRFSNLVNDYTDGQFTIGSFQIYNNKANWNSVNIHVLNKSWYRANAALAGYYYGGIIQVGRDAWGQPWNTPMGAVTLAHELGHYALMLPDEYIEATQEPRCNNNTAGTCIMSDPYSYFELCTAESHNAQSTGDSHSCWYYVKYYYPEVTEVHGAPDPGPTTGPPSKITWHYPDLWMLGQEMTASLSKINEGTNVTLTVPVHNSERLVSSSVNVRFYLDSASSANMIKSLTINMAGQDAPTASCSWQAVGGAHTIIAVIDPDNTVRELDDSNNQASRQLVVNSRPRISNTLSAFTSREDIPLTVKMTQYATDPEDAAYLLRWSVVTMDTHAIVSVSGQNGPDQNLTFNPVTHWSGTTKVVLGVSDTGNLMSQKEVEITFSFHNYPPSASDPSVSPASVLRGRSVDVTSGALDVEDRESQLTPIFEWKPNGTDDWKALSAYFDGARFRALLAVPPETPLGKADIRVAFKDTLENRGTWAYLNSSLLVQNNRPQVGDIGLSDGSVVRGGLVTVFVNASDQETASSGLGLFLECRVTGGQWLPIGTEAEFQDGSWMFQLDVNASWPAGIHDIRAMVRDPDGASSDWMELSDAIVVMNSEPVINSARVVRTRMLRNESCAVTVTGEDYETPRTELSVEFRVRDPRGKEQPGYITRARWVNGSWEATFSPLLAAAPGKYNLSARLGDADGGWSSWKDMPSAVEVGNNLPAAAFTGPQSAVQGSMVSFDGAGSSDIEDQSNLLTFGWSFGDGSAPGIGRLATHSFARAGTFKVTLSVTDRDGGTATAQRTVSVTERPAAPITGGGTISWLAIGIIVIVVAAAAGAYLMMKKKKASGGAGPSQAASARVAAPQAAVQYVPLHPQTRQENGAMHENMEQCRQTHGEQRRADQPTEEPSKDGTYQARTYQAGAYPAGAYQAGTSQAGAYMAGPSPGPYPMPGPGPDPLRPTEPEPGPGPYPEPDDDDDDD